MRLLIALVGVIVLSGCAGNGYKQFYQPYMDLKTNPNSDMQLLGENETPVIMSSNNFNRDVRVAKSKYFWPVGYSSFNGEMGTQADIIDQARNVGASLVLVNSQFAETRTITTPLFVPTTQTTTYSGTTNGSIYGNNGLNANYNSNANGLATTTGTTVVPMTRYQQRFNQQALFFVKEKTKGRLGINMLDLSPELRAKYQRNTGVFVDVVKEGSAAFEANILPDDVIVNFNGTAVVDQRQFIELLNSFSGGKCTMKILRGDAEKLIEVQLKPI
jgi:hypothetical protein